MKNNRYAIITPAYNEALFLPDVIASIAAQSVRPVKWIIVDDRSSDTTWDVIGSASKTHDFVVPVQVTGDKERRVGANVVHVFNVGLAALSDEVDFIVKMDADVTLPTTYFERIIGQLNADPSLGMVSGKTYIEHDGEWLLERIPDTHVSGACKAYRMQCFNDIGGLKPYLGWDILDGAKARMNGWKTRSLRDLPLYHMRMSSSAKGMLRGRLRTGKAMYTVRAHPLFVIGKSLFRAIEKPYLSSLLIPFGYLGCFIVRPERLDDAALGKFLRQEQVARLLGKTRSLEELSPRKLKGD